MRFPGEKVVNRLKTQINDIIYIYIYDKINVNEDNLTYMIVFVMVH